MSFLQKRQKCLKSLEDYSQLNSWSAHLSSVFFSIYFYFNFCLGILVMHCLDGCRTDILILFLNQDPNLLRSYVVRKEGIPLLGLLVRVSNPSCLIWNFLFFKWKSRLSLRKVKNTRWYCKRKKKKKESPYKSSTSRGAQPKIRRNKYFRKGLLFLFTCLFG